MIEENSLPLVPLEISLTSLKPSEPVKMWIEIEERGFVTGYSSSESTHSSVVFNSSDIPEDFEMNFISYRIDEDLNLIKDDTRLKELIKEKEEYDKLPTDKEKIELLEKENESLKLEILETKQRALMTEEAILDLATMIISV